MSIKSKHYTAQQVAALRGRTPALMEKEYQALVKQLQRDSLKPENERKYPHAYKTECCGSWRIPERDLK